MGGAGTFAAVGALMVAGREQGKRVSHIIDAGHDFPVEHRKELQRWGTDACFREHEDRLTVRAWNQYNGDDESASKLISGMMNFMLKIDTAFRKETRLTSAFNKSF